MSKPETIRVELSAADRRLLQRVVDALERNTPPNRLRTPVHLRKLDREIDDSMRTRLTEPIRGQETGVETNPTLFQRLTGNVPPVEPDGDPDITYALTEKGQKWLRNNG